MSENEIEVNPNYEFDEISAAPDDVLANYTVIPNSLIRDMSLSPAARWLIIYLVSNKPGWKIKLSQLTKHTKGFIGRDVTRKIFNEGIEAGYIKKNLILRRNPKNNGMLRGYSYEVSSTPKFKNSLRHTEIQYTEVRFTENQDAEGQYGKEVLYKEVLSNKNNTSLKVPNPGNPEMADAIAANAAGEVLKPPKQKKPKPNTEFSPQVKEVTSKMLTIIAEHNPVYRPPDNLDKFHQEVEQILEKDKQNPDVLLQTFEWACSDCEQRDNFKGWQSVVCTNKRKGKPSNPAEIFRGHFSTIYSQMKSRKKRLFSPCSDDAKALAAMEEWAKDAL